MRALVFKSMVCVYLCVRKIFRILLWQQKFKTKQKAFATCVDGNEKISLPPHYS